jgi:hypothetical protein
MYICQFKYYCNKLQYSAIDMSVYFQNWLSNRYKLVICVRLVVHNIGGICKHDMTYYKLFHVRHYVSLQNANINLTLKFKEILFLTIDSCYYASYGISEHKLPCSVGTKSSEKRYRWKSTMSFEIGIIQAPLFLMLKPTFRLGILRQSTRLKIIATKLRLNCKYRQNFVLHICFKRTRLHGVNCKCRQNFVLHICFKLTKLHGVNCKCRQNFVLHICLKRTRLHGVNCKCRENFFYISVLNVKGYKVLTVNVGGIFSKCLFQM